jgi:hypothetical protein
MIKDYSEITATINLRVSSLNAALNDKQYNVATSILRALSKDMDSLMEYVMDKVEAKRE